MVDELRAIAMTKEVRLFDQGFLYVVRPRALNMSEWKEKIRAFLNRVHPHLSADEIRGLQELMARDWKYEDLWYARLICNALVTRLHESSVDDTSGL